MQSRESQLHADQFSILSYEVVTTDTFVFFICTYFDHAHVVVTSSESNCPIWWTPIICNDKYKIRFYTVHSTYQQNTLHQHHYCGYSHSPSSLCWDSLPAETHYHYIVGCPTKLDQCQVQNKLNRKLFLLPENLAVCKPH